jgi:hypothetical protein
MKTFMPSFELLEARNAPSSAAPSFHGVANGSYRPGGIGTFSVSGTASTQIGDFKVTGSINRFAGVLSFTSPSNGFAMVLNHGFGSHGLTDYRWAANINGIQYFGEATLQLNPNSTFVLSFHT